MSSCLLTTIISDGPALRSNALITWANYLISQGNTSYVSNTLWPIIQLDLDYVANYWNQTGYVIRYSLIVFVLNIPHQL
jgi:hypothetical protein